jgi:hypothetical protein
MPIAVEIGLIWWLNSESVTNAIDPEMHSRYTALFSDPM